MNIAWLPKYGILEVVVLEVGQECSGIRSSWVLFISSILASYLFLTTSWRKVALVAFVIPLGILRNGFRILVIGLLCVHIGPHMIESPIHHRGSGIYEGLPSPFEAGRYHSLVVERRSLPPSLEVTSWTDEDEIMGLRHEALDVEGVQFHPESILTLEGKRLLQNWLGRVAREVEAA